ncbi:hypothetical protein Tco_1171310 [Tanacetum coccineum]
MLTARSRQKSYANRRSKPLEFEFGDMVLLKVLPWKGAVHFGKQGKLSPRYIGPFRILARKFLAEGDIVVLINEIQLDDKLHMIEEPVEIVDREIIMVNVIPPDHVDDVPVVEPNQPDDVPVIPEPVLVDEDEDVEEEEFKEEEEPQEEDDMEPEDMIKVEDTIEFEDETVPTSVHEVGNKVRSSVKQRKTAMEKLVGKLSNTEENAECKKLKKELEKERFSNTFLRMQNERVERDLYWTRVRAHEFYRKMVHRGFVFEERPNEAIDVPVEDEKSPLSEPRGSARDSQ